MSLLTWLSYGAAVVAFLFVTLALAQSLLTVAEIIEEHSRTAKTIGQRGIYVIIALHLVLYYFDQLPFTHIAFSIACHLVYLQNFNTWPFISLSSISFIASCVLVLSNHFLWFFYWAEKAQEAKRRHGATGRVYRSPHVAHPAGFAEIATFFGICVWLAPLFLFLSLSANDNALPIQTVTPGTSAVHKDASARPPQLNLPPTRSSLFKTIFDPLLALAPFNGFRRFRPDPTDGLIAPRSPISRSPLPSPTNTNGWTFADHQNLSRPPSPGWGAQQGVGLGIGDLGHGQASRIKMGTPPPPRRVTTDGLTPRAVSTGRASFDESERSRPSSRLARPGSYSKLD